MGASLVRWVVASLAVTSLGTAVATVSCGGDDASTAPAKEAGADAVSPPDAQPSDGGVAPTPKSACLTLLNAISTRFAECGLGSNLGYLEALCPDYQFANGSPRTIDQVLACANARSAQSCADYRVGRTPTECAIVGTLPAASACSFGVQCASARCSASQQGACGECLAPLGPDAGCLDDVRSACGYNMGCIGGFCGPLEAQPSLQRGDVCPSAADAGLGCPSDAPCSAPAPLAPTGTCEALPPAGSPCRFRTGASTSLCGQGTTCVQASSSSGTCTLTGTAGSTCGTDVGLSCDVGLYCSQAAVGTCIARGALNEPCSRVDQCLEGSYCKITQASPKVGTCAAGAAVGEACPIVPVDGGAPYGVACVTGADCVTTVVDASVSRTCIVNGLAIGDPCEPFRQCSAPLVCEQGKCAVPTCPADAGP